MYKREELPHELVKDCGTTTVILSLTFLYIYSVTKILRKIRATTFTEKENYACGGMRAWDERTPLPISVGSVTLYPFATR